MEKIYFRKIREGELNPFTEDYWKLEDVPLIWRHKVETLLEAVVEPELEPDSLDVPPDEEAIELAIQTRVVEETLEEEEMENDK